MSGKAIHSEIHNLADVARTGARIALPDSGDVRAKCRAAADELLGKRAGDALFAAEIPSFPGRLGIMHRDLPEMMHAVMRTWPSPGIISFPYWTGTFPNHFEFVAVPSAERFFTQIALARITHPLRPRAMKASQPKAIAGLYQPPGALCVARDRPEMIAGHVCNRAGRTRTSSSTPPFSII